jgi:hypothetical protein
VATWQHIMARPARYCVVSQKMLCKLLCKSATPLSHRNCLFNTPAVMLPRKENAHSPDEPEMNVLEGDATIGIMDLVPFYICVGAGSDALENMSQTMGKLSFQLVEVERTWIPVNQKGKPVSDLFSTLENSWKSDLTPSLPRQRFWEPMRHQRFRQLKRYRLRCRTRSRRWYHRLQRSTGPAPASHPVCR